MRKNLVVEIKGSNFAFAFEGQPLGKRRDKENIDNNATRQEQQRQGNPK